MSDTTERHPVWSVYDEWRTARLNIKCLSWELKRLTRWNRLNEGIIGIAGASSIGGLSLFNSPPGSYAWKTLGVIAVILGVLKPVFQLNDRRMTKSKLLTGYQVLDHDLDCVAIAVKDRQAYDDVAKNEFRSALNRKKELLTQDDGSAPPFEIRKKFEA